MKRTKRTETKCSSIQKFVSPTEEKEDILIMEVSKEFFPDWNKQVPAKWVCPLCYRPHHKNPGPFFYGMKTDKTNDIVTISVRASGCCGWHQYFPYKNIRERTINPENINSVIQEVFSHLRKRKRIKTSVK